MPKIKSIALRLTIAESNPLLFAELLKLEPRQRARWLENAASAHVAARMRSTAEIEALVIKLLTEREAARPAATHADATVHHKDLAPPSLEAQRPLMSAGAKAFVKNAKATWLVERTTASATK